MAVRIFLGFSVLVWLPYGLLCLFVPSYLSEVAGVVASSATGTLELRAMYGGLQSAIGVLAAVALFRPTLVRPALLAQVFLCSGLFLARVVGLVFDAGLSGYTVGALGFELFIALVGTWLLTREPVRSYA